MIKILAAVLAVLGTAAALMIYVNTDEDNESGRRGLVYESTAPESSPSATETTSVASALAPLPLVRSTEAGNRLVIGRISTDVQKYIPRLQAMADYLSSELADQGITGVDIRLVDTLEEMRELFRRGEVDLVSETAFGAIELERDGLTEMLLREWKSGVPEYSTVIFARRDSGIGSLDDLIGRNFVFEDRGSTSGYLVPRAYLARAGYDLVQIQNLRVSPPAGSIGFAFADDGGGDNAVSQVVRGMADVGAASNLDWEDEEEVSRADRSNLVVVHETDPIIRSIMLVRSSLDPVVKERLATLLERMHETAAGRETLRQYSKVARFDRIEGDALVTLLNARFMYETFRSF